MNLRHFTTRPRSLGQALEKNSLRPMPAGEYLATPPLWLFVRLFRLKARDQKGREMYLDGIWREVPPHATTPPACTPLSGRIAFRLKDEATHLRAWLLAQRYILAQHLRWHPVAGLALRLLYPTQSLSHTPRSGWRVSARKSTPGRVASSSPDRTAASLKTED